MELHLNLYPFLNIQQSYSIQSSFDVGLKLLTLEVINTKI